MKDRKNRQMWRGVWSRWAATCCGLILGVLLFTCTGVFADDFQIVPEQSVFAVVTHKGGFAGGLAHDHFISASKYTARLQFTDSDSLVTKLDLRFAAEDLVVDSKELRERWYPRLEAMGILGKPFASLSDEDREKIRKTMLDDKQLDATAFPEISAQVLSIEEETKSQGDAQLSHRVTLALSLHGKTVEKPVWARYEVVDGILRVEAVGEFRFRDFDIKPYSAMLGAVKVKDEFHLYVAFDAVPNNE